MNDLLTKTQRDAWCYMFESDRIKRENAELRNDKKRLDWLMSMIGWASTREDIDRMMGDEEDDGDLDRLNQDI